MASSLKIKEKAILVGFDSLEKCVYSEIINLSDYWDSEHVWDSSASVKRLKLRRMTGFLFGMKGEFIQQFESFFDQKTGIFEKGWARHKDGTVKKHGMD